VRSLDELVAGATRGAGRGIAVALGEAGATVYCTGRTTREQRSESNRPETIEETAEQVTAPGGTGIAVQVDHPQSEQVDDLVRRIDVEQGRLDVLVSDVGRGQVSSSGTPRSGDTASMPGCACCTAPSTPT
jgi:NAD(P)-dependent dehydrogenase (short-subunit alcohol dehydrogenase family)